MQTLRHTTINTQRNRFLINGCSTYSETPGTNPQAHGLLMNARFIQGIFDDREQPERFARFGHSTWDPDANTDALIQALPEWYAAGLRAFTVGLQGGGPCFTISDWGSIDNNPFGETGTEFDPAYEARLTRLLAAADKLGMVVIVSLLYQGQADRLRDGRAVRSAVETGTAVLKNSGYANIIVEVANEYTVGRFRRHPIVSSAEGMAYLIELVKEKSGFLVGCSGGGGEANREVNELADIILLHGNGCTRQQLYETIARAKSWGMDKPIVINEDSACIGQLAVTFPSEVSWGYYNNMTKQEPPAQWGITRGEDQFFAHRMAEGLGLPREPIPENEAYYLQGFESEMTVNGRRWLRLASLYPESVDFVEFYRDGVLYYSVYDEPFSVHYRGSWMQGAVTGDRGEVWEARVHLRDNRVVVRKDCFTT